MSAKQNCLNSKVAAWALFSLAAFAYAWIAAAQIGRAYVDFGDGNYLYIARRILDGLVPYRDIMAPQPPMHLLLGAGLLSLGEKFGAEILVVRCCSILLHIGAAALIASIARWTIAHSSAGAPSASPVAAAEPVVPVHFVHNVHLVHIAPALAGAIYLFLPNGLIWSLGYQSEPLEILFLLAGVRLLLPLRPPLAAGAGACFALAIFTNMTAVPYAAVAALWLLVRRWRVALAFLAPLGAILVLGIAAMELWTGAYLQNVFFNQVGTFPKQGPVAYAFVKISRASGELLSMEGAAIAAAVVGILAYWWRERRGEAEFLSLYAFASLGSLVFVSKGGTEQYIFTIGEPYVAIFAAYAFVVPASAGLRLAKMAALTLFAAVFLIQASFHIYQGAVRGGSLELPPERVDQAARLIERYSEPGAPLLTPPFFAFISGRTVAAEYNEIFIWNIGYWVEQDFRSPEERPRPAQPTDGPFTKKVFDLAGMLDRQEIPLVLLDMEQTGRVPEILEALVRRYRPLTAREWFTRNTPFLFFIPRQEGEAFAPLAQTLDELIPMEREMD